MRPLWTITYDDMAVSKFEYMQNLTIRRVPYRIRVEILMLSKR